MSIVHPGSFRPAAAPIDGRPGGRISGLRSGRLLPVAAVLLLLSCDQMVVDPVPVATVEVDPESAQLNVGAQLQMQVHVLDVDGNPLSGHPVSWTSSDEGVVTVSGSGVATAANQGTATVRATVDGQTGQSTIVVRRPTTIVLDRSSVAFSATAGGADPAPVKVSITNGGVGSLGDLATSTAYGSGASGWLGVTLSGTDAPTTLTLQTNAAALDPGSYAATVSVSSAAAENSPVQLDVTLQVQQNVPTAASNLTASAAADTTVTVRWTDNSDNESEFLVERMGPGDTSFQPLASVGPDVVVYVDSAVAVDGRYVYRVRACGATGCSPFSNEAAASTLPVPPSGVSAVVVSATSIDVTWADSSATETSFRIERRKGTAPFAQVGSVAADVQRFTDTGLESNTAYDYRVRACNGGGCSGYSEVAAAATQSLPIPSAPSALAVGSVSTSSIPLSWTDNSDNETGFQVDRRAPGETAFSLLATTGADAQAYTDSTVAADGNYAYRVRACAPGGCSAYTAVVTATTPPVAPSGLSASALSDTRISLQWTDNSATETAFRIERKTAGGTFAQVATTGADVTVLTDTGLQPATGYVYRVRACNGGGCSPFSAEATATTLTTPVPNAPTNLQATLAADTTAQLSWTDQSPDETEFRVQRSDDGGAFAALATVGANVVTLRDTGIEADHTYAYRVQACGTGGCSDFSNIATIVTVPAPPSGLAATPTGPTTADLAWTDNSATETEFRIERRTGTATFALIATVGAGIETFADSALHPGTAYDYRVRACNDGGCSPFSGVATAATPLLSPTGLSASATSATVIRLAWTDASDNETEFRIQRASGTGGYQQVGTVAADTTSYTDSGLQPETTYSYRVLACNAVSCSAPAEAQATTPILLPPADPGNLSAILAADESHIQLSWTDNADNADSVRVERRVDTGGFARLATLPADADSLADADIARDHVYGYRVQACNLAGCSGYTAEDSAVTRPVAVTGVNATVVSAHEVDVAWTDDVNTEDEFRLERSTDGVTFAPLVTLPADTTFYADTTTVEDTQYAYRILSCNSAGCSEPSAADSALTPPAAPTGLTATTVSDTSIALNWTNSSTTATELHIQRQSSGSGFADIFTLPPDSTDYIDATLVPSTKYDYLVLACNAGGCTASNQASARTQKPGHP